jgi:peptidoglycan/xylan/chitin deacetylase (PgdA/CDA1 family)
MIVINFHHVEEHILHASRKQITASPSGLRKIIKCLRRMGYEIVSLNEILAHKGAVPLGAKKALITFDDGYVNNLTEALPILEEERCPATVFVLPGRFGGTNEWDQGDLPVEKRDALMTLEQMHQIARSPYITLGSHGMTHVKMSQVSDDILRFELQESHRILSTTFGDSYLPVLAYPWGDHSDRVVNMMEETPYQYAFTVETAQWVNGVHKFRVPRYSAFYRDGNPVVFLAKMARHHLLMA